MSNSKHTTTTVFLVPPDTMFFAKEDNLGKLEEKVQRKVPQGITVIVLPPLTVVVETKQNA